MTHTCLQSEASLSIHLDLQRCTTIWHPHLLRGMADKDSPEGRTKAKDFFTPALFHVVAYRVYLL